MLKLFQHYVEVQAGHAGPDIDKSLDPVLILYEEQTIYLNLWGVDILNISAAHVRQPDMPAGCLLMFGKLLRIF